MCEQSIIGARASVMVYDDIQKKWVPSGSSSGLSKVQIYHHQQNNTFRVVGRKLQDHEVVINCSIVKGLKYNQATTTFHQWRDSKYVYGLNFSSQQDAEAFSRAMLHALDVLSGRFTQQTVTPIANNSAYEEDMGYRTMTREDAAIIQQQQIIATAPNDTPTTPNSHSSASIQSQTPPQGHHRTSSAPPAPQPPPIPPGFPPGLNAVVPHMQQHFNAGQQMEKHFVHQPIYMPQQSVVQNQNQIPYSQPSIPTNVSQNIDQQPHAGGPIYISSNQLQQPPITNNGVFVSQQQQQQHQPAPPPAFASSSSTSLAAAAAVVGASATTVAVSNTSNYAVNNNQPPIAPPLPPTLCNATAAAVASSVGPPPLQQPMSQIICPPPQPPQQSRNAPPPPPLPPIGMLSNKSDGMDMSSLAAQLQQAKLKRSTKNSPSPSNPPPFENSGSSTSSGGSGGGYGTIGRPKMASMMDEMAKTLARRRAQADKTIEPDSSEDNCRRLNNEKSNTLPHKMSSNTITSSSANCNSSNSSTATNNNSSDSPRLLRKRFGSISDDTIFKQIDGEGVVLTNNQELINFKAEIIREIQNEINKAKQEIIEALKIEIHRS